MLFAELLKKCAACRACHQVITAKQDWVWRSDLGMKSFAVLAQAEQADFLHWVF